LIFRVDRFEAGDGRARRHLSEGCGGGIAGGMISVEIGGAMERRSEEETSDDGS